MFERSWLALLPCLLAGWLLGLYQSLYMRFDVCRLLLLLLLLLVMRCAAWFCTLREPDSMGDDGLSGAYWAGERD